MLHLSISNASAFDFDRTAYALRTVGSKSDNIANELCFGLRSVGRVVVQSQEDLLNCCERKFLKYDLYCFKFSCPLIEIYGRLNGWTERFMPN